jgi:hypothetical protein
MVHLNSQTIGPLEFANAVKPGMTLEMSIILRRRTALRDNKGKCPQCNYLNPTVKATYDWIKWQVFAILYVPQLILFLQLRLLGAVSSYRSYLEHGRRQG